MDSPVPNPGLRLLEVLGRAFAGVANGSPGRMNASVAFRLPRPELIVAALLSFGSLGRSGEVVGSESYSSSLLLSLTSRRDDSAEAVGWVW